MTQNLGEKLAGRIARDEEAERRRKEAAEAAARAESARKHKLVADYFNSVKEIIVGAIEAEQPIPELTLGKRYGWSHDVYELAQILRTHDIGVKGQGFVDNANHPYFSIWYEFDMWANGNGLTVGFEERHDGMGTFSWYVITVKPKTPYQ